MSKIVTRKNKEFVYEHEMTRSRKIGNIVENVINYALLTTFSIMVLGGVLIAMINIVL